MVSELEALIDATKANDEVTPNQREYLISALTRWRQIAISHGDRRPPELQLKADFATFKKHFNTPSLRKTKRPFPDSSLAARARRALLNEGFPGKPYVA